MLSKSGILFRSLSASALSPLLSKLALKLTSSNSILTSNSFSAAQISLSLCHSRCLQISLYSSPHPSQLCVCMHVCVYVPVCICFLMALCAILCVCVFVCVHANLCACFLWRCLLIFICSVRLYTIDLHNYAYLCIACFSLSCKVLSL